MEIIFSNQSAQENLGFFPFKDKNIGDKYEDRNQITLETPIFKLKELSEKPNLDISQTESN